ncbi:serine hydrolase [Paractinoplanes toevensis]|uniref:serine hydrolase n=1 Tax=Paractinoplanes toevensis TaxID=571911 RepID=UPI001BB2F3A3|nr:serine hydrolase [Actinoplanes toevensis]
MPPPPLPFDIEDLDHSQPAYRTFTGPAVTAEEANTAEWRRAVLAEQTAGIDQVNGLFLRWGLGFALSDPRTLAWVPSGRIGYWGGWGGSMGVVDLDRRMTIGYVMNRMGGDILGSDRSADYIGAVYEAMT